MSKRRNENGQVRREDYEAADDGRDGDVASDAFDIGFQRASDESLRQRRIVKARVGGAVRAAKPADTSAGTPAAAASNPFRGFQGLTGATAAASPKTHPFAGFTGLAAATTTSAVSNASASVPKTTTATTTPRSTPALSYQDAIAVLNKDFLTFVNDQAKQNPSVSWIKAVQEYVAYADKIAEQYATTQPVPIDQQPQQATKTKTTVSSSPIEASSSGFSFGAASMSSETTAAKPASASGFSFGATTTSRDTTLPPATTGGFSFGGATGGAATDAASSRGFSFGAAKQVGDTKKPAPVASTGSGGFSVGTTVPKTSDDANKATPITTSGFSFGTASSGASSGFSAGAKTSDDANKATPSTTSGFSFGTASSGASSGFSFGSFGSTAAASSSGFSFKPASGASAAAAPAAGAADEEDDVSVGREEATVILKSDSLDDDAVFDVEKAKVFEFKKDEKRWADKGLHPLKVLVNKDTKKARILVRNEIGKVVLNASLYKGMSVTAHEVKGKRAGAVLSLQVDGAMTQFLLKVNAAHVDAFLSALEKAAADA